MITSFSGEYRFLSNFWIHPILFEGMIYPSNEHAYVAAKTIVLSERELIQKLETFNSKLEEVSGAHDKLRNDLEDLQLQASSPSKTAGRTKRKAGTK